MLTVCSGPSALLGGNARGELSGREIAELIMSSRLLQADYGASSSLKPEVSKSLRAGKLINTEPSRTGWSVYGMIRDAGRLMDDSRFKQVAGKHEGQLAEQRFGKLTRPNDLFNS